MAIICVVAHGRAQSAGDRTFCILFGSQWVCLALVYLALAKLVPSDFRNYWVPQCIDMVGSAVLLAGCYALYMGEAFTPLDPRFKKIFEGTTILILLTACAGFVSNRTDLPTWHVFAMSASQLLGCTSLLALGHVAGRRLPAFKMALYLLSLYYALLQVPAYYALFVQPVSDLYYVHEIRTSHPDAEFLKGALAGGKIVFVIYALAIDGTFNTGREKAAGWILLAINIALSVGVALFKIRELL